MSEMKAAGTIILFFGLRCIAPIMITMAIAYLMNRLVDRWEAEEAAQEKPVITGVQPVMPTTKVADSTALKIPCWLIRNCDEKKRASCPACSESSLPCWIARLMSEGALPDDCPDCPIYDPRLVLS